MTRYDCLHNILCKWHSLNARFILLFAHYYYYYNYYTTQYYTIDKIVFENVYAQYRNIYTL